MLFYERMVLRVFLRNSVTLRKLSTCFVTFSFQFLAMFNSFFTCTRESKDRMFDEITKARAKKHLHV